MRRLLIALAVLLGLTVVIGAIVLDRMFPHSDRLEERPLPEARESPPRRVLARLLEEVGSAAYKAGKAPKRPDYRYLRESPYLAGHEAALGRLFNIAVGDVLLDEALSQVKHAGAHFEGRYALMARGERVTWTLADRPKGARLSGGLAALGEGCRARINGHEETFAKGFVWHDFDLPLEAGEVSLVAEGDCTIFLADPVVHVPAKRRAMNVLYINVCTLRADDLGSYGQTRPVSPHMDRVAAEGLRFSHARANGNWSKSSQMSALLGRMPSAIGNHYFRSTIRDFAEQTVLHAAWPGVPARLREAGYDTVALVDNVFIHPFLGVGIDLGFARVVDDMRHIKNGSAIADGAIDYMERQGDRPWLLYLNIANAHSRYRPPRDDLMRMGFGLEDVFGDLPLALHLGEVAFVDRQIGRVLEALKRLGLEEDTLVVLHADHGELLAADRQLEVTARSTVTPRLVKTYTPTRYKHGWTWFEDELRVPLILKLPGRIAPKVIDTPVSLIDLAPTVLRLAGLEPRGMKGQDLRHPQSRGPILTEGKQFDALYDEGFKYVRFFEGMTRWRHAGGEWRDTPRLLFDLSRDPREATNLADDAAQRARVQRFDQALLRQRPKPAPLHFMVFEGPPDTRFIGALDGALSELRVRGATQLLGAKRRDGLDVSLGDRPVTLSFRAHRPPRVKLATPDSVTWRSGPHGLPIAKPDARTLAVGDSQVPRIGGKIDSPRITWWTQRIAGGGPEPFQGSGLDESLMEAMKDWGYAH